MNNEKIIKILNSIKPQPDKVWQESFYNYINNLEDGVTNLPQSRNSRLELFKFLKLSKMSQNLKIILSIVSVITTLTAGGGTVYASDSANPGDFLYGLDQTVESFQRAVTTDPVKSAELEIKLMDERVLELQKVTEANETENIAQALDEVTQQQTRIQERLVTMNELRVENKLQTQEQLKVMEQLQLKVQEQLGALEEVKNQLKSNGDTANSDKASEVKNQLSEDADKQVKDFEEATGLQINEAENEQNQGEDSEIQNQNQNETQNAGDTSNNDQGNTDNQQQQSGDTGQQGGNN